jgi:hypothetical protein
MSRAVLLWTERPVLIDREIETHAWMEAHRPWEKFDLELIHDTAPGDWRHYSVAFHDAWHRAREAGLGFINLESDVVPTEEAFEQLLGCREYVCTVPYPIHNYFKPGEVPGHSAVVELRCPGGWDCHFAREGEAWAQSCDLGLVRYSQGFVAGYSEFEIPQTEYDNGLLHEAVSSFIQRRLGRDKIHLHWPAIKNNHYFFDEGDYAHHPPGFQPLPGMLGKKPA